MTRSDWSPEKDYSVPSMAQDIVAVLEHGRAAEARRRHVGAPRRGALPELSLRGARSDMYAPETMPKMKIANPRLQVLEIEVQESTYEHPRR